MRKLNPALIPALALTPALGLTALGLTALALCLDSSEVLRSAGHLLQRRALMMLMGQVGGPDLPGTLSQGGGMPAGPVLCSNTRTSLSSFI